MQWRAREESLSSGRKVETLYSTADLEVRAMWLIDRDTPGLDGSRIPLPTIVREALVRWYVGDGTHHDEIAGINLVQQARIGMKWIACDCLGREKAPPILTPAYLSEAETYYLRRLTQRPEHREDCPFFRDQATNRVTEVRSRATANDAPAGFFSVLKPAPENLSKRPESDVTDDRTRNASTPRLARLLWRLIDTSGVNVIAPLAAHEEWSIRENFQSIGRAAAQIEIAPGIELARAIWTHHRPLEAKAVYATLRRLSQDWPAEHEPQGFVLLFSKGHKANEIFLTNGESISIANRVQSPAVRGNPVHGPFLTMIVVGKYPEARGYSLLRAYAQPIYNGRLFVPVDSQLERDALRDLLEVQRRLHREDVDVAVRKPIFDSQTPAGNCRPDFILEARSRRTGEIKTLVIEVMGFENDTYRASKSVTHPRMSHLGTLSILSAREIEAGNGAHHILQELNL